MRLSCRRPDDAGLRDASHQLLDEGRADSLGAPCGFVNQRVAERQALAIELDKLFATDVVRQRNLDRLIDAARTVRQVRSQAAPAGWS